MELHHHFTVPASVGTTWSTLMDLAGVAECFPGATVTSVEGDTFQGTCKVKLGPIALVYAGSGTFVERDDDAHTALIEAKGKDKRGNGTAGATVRMSVVPDGDSGSAVDVTTDLNVTGKPAQFGRGVMQDVSDKLLGQFVACLETRLGEDEGEPEGSEAAQGPESDVSTTAAVEAPAPGPPVAPAAPAAPAAIPEPVTPPAAPTVSGVSAPRLSTPAARPTAPPQDDAIDLGATVLPVLLRSYAPQLAAGVLGVVIGILIGRRSR